MTATTWSLLASRPDRARGVWLGWWRDERPARRHSTFKETRRGIARRAARLFTLRCERTTT